MYYSFSTDMPLMYLINQLVHDSLAIHIPHVQKRLQDKRIPDSLWIGKMTMTLFLDCIQMTEALRLWDYIITRGALLAIPELITGIVKEL